MKAYADDSMTVTSGLADGSEPQPLSPRYRLTNSIVQLAAISPLISLATILTVVGDQFAGDVILLAAGIACGLTVAAVGRVPRGILRILVALTLLAAFYTVRIPAASNFDSWKHAAAVFFCLAIFCFFATFSKEIVQSRLFAIAVVASATVAIVAALQADYAKNYYNGVATYPLFLFVFVATIASDRLRNDVLVLSGFGFVALLSWTMDHRAMMALSVGSACLFLVFRRIRINKFLYYAVFLGTCAASFAIYLFYVNATRVHWLRELNYLVHEFTGRGVTSGREYLWPLITSLIEEKPLYGYGPDALPSSFLSTTLSAHNYFLQATLQMGLIGLAIVVVALWFIWSAMTARSTRRTSQALAIALFPLVVLHNTLEVNLLQNALLIATPIWMLFGLASGQALARGRDDRT